jgi:D-alanyl-D-alanine carboxypeptidase/D-alanyl-D-alanine-endopeptidase (penicillin-binding protein 4)
MNKLCVALVLLFALPGWAGPVKPHKAVTKTSAKVPAKAFAKTKHIEHKVSKTAKKPLCKTLKAANQPTPTVASVNEIAKPAADDPDRERIMHLQAALDAIVHGQVLGHLRVGMRVEELSSGRALYSWRSSVLMDPASNQKVLSTTAALLRLGSTFRYRTEVTGTQPDSEGTVAGSLVIRGSGDPSLRPRHIEALAQSLAARGVTRVSGEILGDPRRIGSDEFAQGGRAPLRVGSSDIEVHVRPGDKVGSRPVVSIRPASDAFVVVNQAETRAKGKARLDVAVERAGQRFQVVVSGKISMAKGEAILHRAPPSQPIFAALLLRHALVQAGIDVHGGVGIYSGDGRARVSSLHPLDGAMVALAAPSGDSSPPLAEREPTEPRELLALHESEPLVVLLRRVNKDSDNEWAERVLETVGAEVMGGAPTTAKGVHILRESLAELGLPTTAFSPANGSGLGHQNRVTAAGMDDLLRRIYFDPRIGPELMQSLSVGGVDGTTRNRFHGTSSAHRVRAKTGTLTGVSCLSGYVGDGSDVLVFSILVEGHRKRAVTSVRATQVSAVNAMMRFARHAESALPDEENLPGTDLETGSEVDEAEGAGLEGTESSAAEHSSETAP